jgi:hypothetical protein
MIKSPQIAFRTTDVQDRQRALILFSWLLLSGCVRVPSSPENRKGTQMCENQLIKLWSNAAALFFFKWMQLKKQLVESPVFSFSIIIGRDRLLQLIFSLNLCFTRYSMDLDHYPTHEDAHACGDAVLFSSVTCSLPLRAFKDFGLGHVACFIQSNRSRWDICSSEQTL